MTARSDIALPHGPRRPGLSGVSVGPPRLAVGGRPEDREDGGLAVEERRRTQRPERQQVILHNDDYTSMEFVVDILVRHFHKSPTEALQIMLQVHHKGRGVAGVYPPEVAETKVAEVTSEAREQGFPLLLTTESA